MLLTKLQKTGDGDLKGDRSLLNNRRRLFVRLRKLEEPRNRDTEDLCCLLEYILTVCLGERRDFWGGGHPGGGGILICMLDRGTPTAIWPTPFKRGCILAVL